MSYHPVTATNTIQATAPVLCLAPPISITTIIDPVVPPMVGKPWWGEGSGPHIIDGQGTGSGFKKIVPGIVDITIVPTARGRVIDKFGVEGGEYEGPGFVPPGFTGGGEGEEPVEPPVIITPPVIISVDPIIDIVTDPQTGGGGEEPVGIPGTVTTTTTIVVPGQFPFDPEDPEPGEGGEPVGGPGTVTTTTIISGGVIDPQTGEDPGEPVGIPGTGTVTTTTTIAVDPMGIGPAGEDPGEPVGIPGTVIPPTIISGGVIDPTDPQPGETPVGTAGEGGGSPPVPRPIRSMPTEAGVPAGQEPIPPKPRPEEWIPEPVSMSEPITSLALTDPAFNPFDMKYNYGIEANQDILALAIAQTPNGLGLDPNRIYSDPLPLVVRDVLASNGGNTSVPFNGVTIGSFLYQTSLVKNSLSQQTINSLDFLKNQNLTSYNIGSYLVAAIKQATYKGVIGDYSSRLFSTLAKGAASVFPNGLPTFSDPITNRNTAFGLIKNGNKQSLNPGKYTESGDSSRITARTYLVGPDIRLQISPVKRDSSICGVEFKLNGAISVVKRDGTAEDVFHTLEFLPVVQRNSKICSVVLYSDRDKAFKFGLPELSVILGLLGDSSTNPNAVSEYGVDFNVTATFGTEASGAGKPIPDVMLYELVPSTITDQLPSDPRGDKITYTATYKRVWKEGDDSDDAFNTTVAAFSGPRQNFYIPAEDPIWNFILEANADHEFYINVTYNDLNPHILDGMVFPRTMYTDFCISPTDKPKFNIFQGGSILNSYPEGETLNRIMSFILSPFSDNEGSISTKPVKAPTGLNVGGETDLLAINFTKAFSAGDKIKLSSKTGESFSSKKSILGKFLTTLSDIDTNYNLQDGNLGKRLPMGDLFSFMNITDMIDLSMGQLSSGIISSLFFGQLNDIKLFSIKKTDSEKTYISSTRLKSGGTSLESDQNQKTVPKIGYFRPKFKNILY